MKNIVFLIFLECIFSQTTFHFLEQPVDARSLALTNGTSASPSEYLSVNPATVRTESSGIRFSNINFPADIHNYELSFITNMITSVIFGRIKTADYGEFIDGANEETSTAKDIILELGYKSTIKNVISIGIMGGYINSRIAESKSSGIFSNVGIRIRLMDNRLGVGATLTHFGTQLEYYGDTPESFPTAIRTGLYFQPMYLPANLSIDIINYLEGNTQLIGGIEFHPRKNMVFRISSGSYKTDLSTGEFSADFFSGVAIGAGFEFGPIQIDGSVQNLGPAGVITGLTVGWKELTTIQ